LVWGRTTTRQGYTVAKNRDRISVYCDGKAWPTPFNMEKIADALGVEVADLAPGFGAKAEPPQWAFVKVAGQDRVHLRINTLVLEPVAAKIIALLSGGP
jgi:hypothetical protein